MHPHPFVARLQPPPPALVRTGDGMEGLAAVAGLVTLSVVGAGVALGVWLYRRH
jgi:hypothetical protein